MTTMTAHQPLESARIDAFKARIRGEVLLPQDPDYDEARQIWNTMIDRAPALIARCASPEDVVQAVDFARRHQLRVSIRGGGHNIAGNAVCDDGLMIDLSPMKRVQVDPRTRRAPPLPFLPEGVHGNAIVALALCHAGDPAEGEKLIEPLRGFGKAHGEHIGVQPLCDEPTELSGTDAAPAPPEQLMHALASCIAATTNANAAFMGVRLDRLGVTLEGDIDLHGIFDLDEKVRPGFSAIRAKIDTAGDADAATIGSDAVA